MVAVPPDTPLIIPVFVIVATEVLLLLHVPPGVALLSMPVLLIHMAVMPVIAPGMGLTVTVVVV